MAAFPWGALIGAGSSLLGGIFGNKSQQAALDYQKAYNKKKIQWLVQDAQKAGIHPLAALGSPVAGSFASPVGSSPLGDSIADAGAALGAGISRAEERQDRREYNDLSKELIRARIRATNAEATDMLSKATSRTNIAGITAATRGAMPNQLMSAGRATVLRAGQDPVEMFETAGGEGMGMVESAGVTGRTAQDNPSWIPTNVWDLLKGVNASQMWLMNRAAQPRRRYDYPPIRGEWE